jgi:hypothetical protein
VNFYAASYGPRYGDPICTFVALNAFAAATAADKGAQFEEKELPGYCEASCGDCSFCCPDICVWYSGSPYKARELFTAAELKEHRRALRSGEVVALYR